MYDHLAVARPFDIHAHGPERGDRCQSVFALEETADPGSALGQCAQHDGAVGDGFVSGDAGFADRLAPLLAEIEGQPGARLPGTRRIAAMAEARANGLSVDPRHLAAARRLAGQG